VMGEVAQAVNARGDSLAHFAVRPPQLAELIRLVNGGLVSRTAARTVFLRMLDTGRSPSQIAAEEKLLQVGDDDQLRQWIDEVFAEHPLEADRYLRGEKKLQGVLVGFVMKKSRGSADPRKVNQLLAARVTASAG
jgi:aspartyl-tRNA(Asn)/glutamyl-tRNA(Gln) amidotransferase subunit B